MEILYKELSYKIIGLAYKIYNEIGPDYQEKIYQRAFEIELEKEKLNFEREKYVPLTYEGESIGKYFIDFLIENTVVLEFKVGNYFYPKDIKQINGYLKSEGLKLGIVILFTKDGVEYKRILNNSINS